MGFPDLGYISTEGYNVYTSETDLNDTESPDIDVPGEDELITFSAKILSADADHAFIEGYGDIPAECKKTVTVDGFEYDVFAPSGTTPLKIAIRDEDRYFYLTPRVSYLKAKNGTERIVIMDQSLFVEDLVYFGTGWLPTFIEDTTDNGETVTYSLFSLRRASGVDGTGKTVYGITCDPKVIYTSDGSTSPEDVTADYIRPVVVLDGRVKLTADGADTWSISKAN